MSSTARYPAGYNIGVNDGPAAGQTVPHVHMHLIPDSLATGLTRRWIFRRADYWSASGGESDDMKTAAQSAGGFRQHPSHNGPVCTPPTSRC